MVCTVKKVVLRCQQSDTLKIHMKQLINIHEFLWPPWRKEIAAWTYLQLTGDLAVRFDKN